MYWKLVTVEPNRGIIVAFLADTAAGRVLMGSANFTPEGLTSQANLLHLFESKQLAQLYAARYSLIASNPSVPDKASVRVFFSPEPKGKRASIDTVIAAVAHANSSVVFCMFDPTDAKLITTLLATSDRNKLLYGLLNSISDPSKSKSKKKNSTDLSDSGEPPVAPTAATQIKITLFNRSRKDKKVLAYSYFRPGATPAGFLPEFNSVDFSSRSTLGPAKANGKKHAPAAVHIHRARAVEHGTSVRQHITWELRGTLLRFTDEVISLQ